MRILWISQAAFNNTISNTDRIEMPRCLKRRGHQVWMVAAGIRRGGQETPEWCDRLQYVPVPFSRLQLPFFLLGMTFMLPSLLARIRPDFVITDFSLAPLAAPWAAIGKHLGMRHRFVLDVRTCPVYTRGLGGRWRRFQYWLGINLAKATYQGMTVITQELLGDLVREFGVNRAAVGQWSSGASLELFDPETVVERERACFGLSDRFVIMYHGTFRPDRGIETAVRAVAQLAHRGLPISLFVLGDGPLKSVILETVQTERAEDCVVIHPPVPYDQVPSFIKMADVGVNLLRIGVTWWRSQSSLKVMEYFAMEKPMVLSDTLCNREVARSSDLFVRFVTDNEVESAARAIEDLYEQQSLLPAQGHLARQRIAGQYTWDAQARKLETYLVHLSELKGSFGYNLA